MKITLIAFGIAKEILGGRDIDYELSQPLTVNHLLEDLKENYPQIEGLNSIKIAINNEYAIGNQSFTESDEIVLIPPVSGG